MNVLLCLLSLATPGCGPIPWRLDPGRLIPEDMTVFVEILEPAQQIRRLQQSAGWKQLAAQIPSPVRELLELATGSGLKRAALGMDHSFLRNKTIFVLLLEAKDLSEVLW